MKVNSISDVIGYTLDTYSTFCWYESIADEDMQEETEIDHEGYRQDLADLQETVLNNYTDGTVKSFKTTGSYSPREYNFSTDNSELEITVNYTNLKAYVVKHRADFESYLRETFTSYDGFMSYVANNWTDFFKEMSEGDTEHNRNVAIMAGWYFKRECLTEEEYLQDMWEGAHEAAYNNATDLAPAETIFSGQDVANYRGLEFDSEGRALDGNGNEYRHTDGMVVRRDSEHEEI